MIATLRMLVVLAAALVLAGCGSNKSGRTRSPGLFSAGGNVQELHLFGVPVAINFDGDPGPDGVGAMIYASNPRVSKGIPITTGTLEMLLFDGALHGTELGKSTPLKTWSFTPEELKPFASVRSIGTGYQLPLKWETHPSSKHITIIARYLSPGKPAIYSSPSSISLTVK